MALNIAANGVKSILASMLKPMNYEQLKSPVMIVDVAQVLPDFIAQIPVDELLISVHADVACDTTGCYAAIAQRHAATKNGN